MSLYARVLTPVRWGMQRCRSARRARKARCCVCLRVTATPTVMPQVCTTPRGNECSRSVAGYSGSWWEGGRVTSLLDTRAKCALRRGAHERIFPATTTLSTKSAWWAPQFAFGIRNGRKALRLFGRAGRCQLRPCTRYVALLLPTSSQHALLPYAAKCRSEQRRVGATQFDRPGKACCVASWPSQRTWRAHVATQRRLNIANLTPTTNIHPELSRPHHCFKCRQAAP